MRLSILLVPVTLLALFAGPLASPAAASGRTVLQRDDVVRHGYARASLRGHRLLRGRAYLEDSGEMTAKLSYSSDGRRADFTLDVRWREPARGGAKPARDYQPGGGEDLYWHPLKQVRVHYELVSSPRTVDLAALHALAKIAAGQVAGRARPWPEPFTTLRLSREMRMQGDYRLRHAVHLGQSKQAVTTELDYRSPTRTINVRGKNKHLSRGYEISVRWYPQGRRPASNDVRSWQYRETGPMGDLSRRPLYVVHSRTHYIKVDLRGEFYDRNGHKSHFADREHWERAMAHLRKIMGKFEAHLAQPRDRVAAATATPGAVDRPARQATTTQGSGTIISSQGRFAVIRGGARVNVRSGGRVQMGDIIHTGGGRLTIRFDGPEAGPGSNGTLEIAPRSKVTIDVGPYRPKARSTPTRIRLQEGAIHFARPHDPRNPRVELATPGNTAIYGLTGTEAVLALDKRGWIFALRSGSGDLTLRGEHVRDLVPYAAHFVGRDGTYLQGSTFDDAGLESFTRHFGLGAAAAAPALPESFDDAAGLPPQRGGPRAPVPVAPRPVVSAAQVQRINQQIATLDGLRLAAGAAMLEMLAWSMERWTPEAERARQRAFAILDQVYDGWEDLLSLLPREAGLTSEQVAQRDIPTVRASVQKVLELDAALRKVGR